MSEKEELELAKVGYQSAIGMIDHTGNIIWSSFNSMVIANSIIIASISLLASSDSLVISNQEKFIFCLIGSIIGITIVYYWFQSLKSHFHFYHYYMSSAKEIEKLLIPTVIFLNRGETESSRIKFVKDFEKNITIDMERKGPARKMAENIIWIFGIIYFIIFISCIVIGLT